MNSSPFWTHTVWYVALAATSIAALIIIFTKTRERRKTFAFWLAVLGFTYCLEAGLLLLTRAYTYHPLVVEGDPFFDAMIGNIFSQVSVSSSAVLICTLGLSNWWLGGFSVAYFLIDLLFSHLGVYEHYWYHSIYTLFGFFIYGFVARWWHRRVFGGGKRADIPALFFSVWASCTNLLGTGLKLLGIRYFSSGLYPDAGRDHAATGLIYMVTFIAVMVTVELWPKPWQDKGAIPLCLPAIQLTLILTNIMRVKTGWAVPIVLMDLLFCFGATRLMNTFLRSGKSAHLMSRNPVFPPEDTHLTTRA